MEEKICFKYSYKTDDFEITLFASYGKRDDFFPGMRVDDYFCVKEAFGIINRNFNLGYVLKCFDEPERLALIPCGRDIIFCLDEEKEHIQQNLWKILKQLNNDNYFLGTDSGQMISDVNHDPTNN